MMRQPNMTHTCGTCAKGFNEEQEYLDHECSTGFTPQDVAHQDALTDGNYSKIAEEAIKRGEERKEEGDKVAHAAQVE